MKFSEWYNDQTIEEDVEFDETILIKTHAGYYYYALDGNEKNQEFKH